MQNPVTNAHPKDPLKQEPAAENAGAMIHNRYSVIKTLGQGGMGLVYLVKDSGYGDRILALKSIRDDVFSKEALAVFKREFEVMSRLKHPNLVRVFDFGYDTALKQYYITMEYVTGRSLAQVLQEEGRCGAERAVSIIVALSRALSFIHSRNIVHRDINTQNVLLGDNDAVKLLDFGLADLDKSDKQAKGTIAFMPPEVLRGEGSACSDFFSAGMTLYALVTNASWYGTMTGQQIVQMLRNEEAFDAYKQRVLEQVEDTTIAALLRGMVTYKKEDRYRDCFQVVHTVNDGTACSIPVETDLTREAYVLGAGFVGREQELSRLRQPLLDTAGQGKALWVQGDAGVGKSRLFAEFKRYCQLQDILFFEGQCLEDIHKPFGPFLPILSTVLLDAADSLVAGHGPRLKTILPDHRRLGNIAPAPVQDPKADHVALVRSIVDAIMEGAAAGAQHRVLHLNDMQWSDEGSIEALDLLLKKLKDVPQGKCLLHVYLGSRTQGCEALSQMKSAAQLDILRLAPFDERGVQDYIEAVFGAPNIGPQLGDAVVEINKKVGGNPFFLQELIKSLIANEVIVRARQWELTQPLAQANIPGSLVDMVMSRISRLSLSPAQTEALRTMALLNRGISRQELCGIREIEDSFLLELERLEIIKTTTDTGIPLYQIQQDLVRSTIVDRMENRAALHAHIGRSLERLHGEELDAYAEELAHHYYHGQEKDKARHYLKRAAELAAETARNRTAVSCYTTLLSLTDEDGAAEKIDINLHIILCLWELGELRRMNAIAKEILPTAQRLGDKKLLARVYYWLGETQNELSDKGHVDPLCIQALEQAIALSEAEGEKEQIAEALGILAFHYADNGKNYTKAVELFDRGYTIAREMDDHPLMARYLCNMAFCLYSKGNFKKAVVCIEKALPLYTDREKRTIALNEAYLARNYGMLDDFTPALEHADKGVTLALEIENGPIYAFTLTMKADVLLNKKAFQEAKAVCDQLTDVMSEIVDPDDLFRAKMIVAKSTFASGGKERAIAQLMELSDTGNRFDRAWLFYELWSMTGDEKYRNESLALYGDIIATVDPNYFFNQHYERLKKNERIPIDQHNPQPAQGSAGASSADSRAHHATHTQLSPDATAMLRKIRLRLDKNNDDAIEEIAAVLSENPSLGAGSGSLAQLVSSDRLAAFLSVIRDLNSNLDLEVLLHKIVDVCINLLHAQRGAILLFNDAGILQMKAGRDNMGTDLREFPLSRTVIQSIVRERKPVFTTDVLDDAALSSAQSIIDMGVRAVMCAPLEQKIAAGTASKKNKIIGIIYLDSKNMADMQGLNAGDLDLLKTLADQAAVAVYNAFLNEHLEDLVKERTAQLEAAQQEMVEHAHRAGMASVAITILHYIGNTLNSVTTSSSEIAELLSKSKLEGLIKANALLQENLNNLQSFILDDPKGKKLLDYYGRIGSELQTEHESFRHNIKRVIEKTQEIQYIVESQKEHIHNISFSDSVSIHDIVDAALSIHNRSIVDGKITVKKNVDKKIRVQGNKVKITFILTNLVKNALDAMADAPQGSRQLTVTGSKTGQEFILTLTDTGCGIPLDLQEKVFSAGFINKKGKICFNLHTCANNMAEMGGALHVTSGGIGKGAAFSLTFKNAQ